ncbi:hypothetical protein H5T88_06945 [bacterium]|nr:hypothetical protein [bacterium]
MVKFLSISLLLFLLFAFLIPAKGEDSGLYKRMGENIVVNGGFEEEENGAPVGWSIPKDITSLDSINPRSGKFSLKYSRTDKNDYRLITQQIPCVPGKLYEASVWVKGENVKSEESTDQGAGFCIEWYDQNGKWLGGTYPHCIAGTFDWQKITTIVRIPKEAKKVNITLYLRPKNIGTAWFDDVEVVPVASSLFSLALLSPAYRGTILTPTRGKQIKAKILIDREDYDLTGIPLRILSELKDGKGNTLAKSEMVLSEEKEAIISLPLPDLKQGEYDFICHLYSKEKELGKISERISVMQRMKAKVYIDEKQRLRVDGKPFFPIGLYLGPTEDEHLERISKAGFNTILCYGYGVGQNPEAYMERALKYGLKVIYSVKDFYEGTAYFPKMGKSGLELAKEYVLKFRDHPALLAWYINDELPITYIPKLTEMYKLIKSLDPNHPQFQVLYQIPDLEFYYNCTDIMGVDPYPIPSRPISMVSEWTSSAVKAMSNAKPVWVVPQIFDWSVYNPANKPREPTFEEKKNMFYQALINGAKGLIAYSYFDLLRTTGGKEAPKELFEKRWREVCEIVAEIKKIVPVILEGEDLGKLKGIPESEKLQARGILYKGQLYILIANTSDATLSIDISLPLRGWKSATGFNGEQIVIKDDKLHIDLEPLEATTYVLSK